MTNWDRWIKEAVQTNTKRDFLCGFYMDCDECILYKNNLDCTDESMVGKWFDSDELADEETENRAFGIEKGED